MGGLDFQFHLKKNTTNLPCLCMFVCVCVYADSGRGVSRPNSQIDVVDLRVSRTESVGKKSVQSVISDQGATADTGKKHTAQEAIVEGVYVREREGERALN